MKLNLGCGKKIFDGYENIDWPTDIRKLNYPKESCDEIIAIHVFEHFYRHEALEVLKHWVDLLKPGGKLILELPSLTKILNCFNKKMGPQFTTWGLYGDQAQVIINPSMQHMWCWTENELMEEMQKVNLIVTVEPVKFHKPQRDMRLVGIKK